MRSPEPILVADLFPRLYDELFALLDGLSPDDWERQTIASRWSVKDVVAHLLDGDVRRLSFQRDGARLPRTLSPVTDYRSLVDHLDRLNALWATASERMSARVITDFLKLTGPQVCELFARLAPHDTAIFGVAWAGEETSENWFDIAREYTEKWHHQQQIRDAVGAPGLTDPVWIAPYIDTLVRGLPHALRESRSEAGTSILLDIVGEGGGTWTLLRKEERWALYVGASEHPNTTVRIREEVAWRLFSKMASPEQARSDITVTGNERLGEPLLRYVGFMV